MSSGVDPVLRLANLTFALLASEKPRDTSWIREHVDGYSANKSDEAFRKMLRRDIAALRRAGVPLKEEGEGFSVAQDKYFLPEITFSPAEAQVLGMVADLSSGGGLADSTRSGWTKLAAGGARRDLSASPTYHAAGDYHRLDQEFLDYIVRCSRARQRISFTYQPSPTTQATIRQMDPWALISHESRIYLVGWDPERAAPRTFRALYCCNARKHRSTEFVDPTDDPQEILTAALARERVNARVAVPLGCAKELIDAATAVEPVEEGGSRVAYFEGVSRAWLVRAVTSYARDVEVLDPPEVRAEVLSILNAAAEWPEVTND